LQIVSSSWCRGDIEEMNLMGGPRSGGQVSYAQSEDGERYGYDV